MIDVYRSEGLHVSVALGIVISRGDTSSYINRYDRATRVD
jgi:hypothetical protein